MLDNYCKTVLIEANTMIDMAKTEIAPAVSEYVLELAKQRLQRKRQRVRFPAIMKPDC